MVWLADRLTQKKYAKQMSNKMAPITKKTTDPNNGSFSGAATPNLIALAIFSEGSSKPSWAHRKGSTRSLGIFVIEGTSGIPLKKIEFWMKSIALGRRIIVQILLKFLANLIQILYLK